MYARHVELVFVKPDRSHRGDLRTGCMRLEKYNVAYKRIGDKPGKRVVNVWAKLSCAV